ncbi:putative enterotoxin [Ophiocordyceps unilateralis]|uniref:Enterotoxin n=1 Tax=Ophiocordyceps unilateralis TaxID=268505 RepID=A0A2A9P3S7_OPHUN|nr:putative enterotoxin [Ophiocordyceps unilateralis]
MHGANIFFLAAALWLSWLGAGNTSSLPSNTILFRRSRAQLPVRIVYRGDERSPEEIRHTGGFQPWGRNWDANELSYSIDRHYSAGPRGCGLDDYDENNPNYQFQSAFVSVTHELGTAQGYGDWMYEITATPNMLYVLDDDDEVYPQGEIFALGGVYWGQIRRYTRAPVTEGAHVQESDWILNPEYDAQLYERSEHVANTRVSVDFPSELIDGQADSGDEEIDSESDDSQDRRPLYNTAVHFVDDHAYELVGSFPLQFAEYPLVNLDVPGPPHPQGTAVAEYPLVNFDDPEAPQPQGSAVVGVEELVNRELRMYTELDSEQMNTFFPESSSPGNWKVERRSSKAGRTNDCCKLVSRIRKMKATKTHKKTHKDYYRVKMCVSDTFHPSCTSIRAGRDGKCFNLPAELKNNVSSLRPQSAAGTCTFYQIPDCGGLSFNASWPGMSLYRRDDLGLFNDQVQSLRCDGVKVCGRGMPDVPWCRRSHKFCDFVDELKVKFELGDEDSSSSGTWDTIMLSLSTARSSTVIQLAKEPSAGFSIDKDIDLFETFKSEKIALADINNLGLLDLPNKGYNRKDAWQFKGK